MEESNEGGVKNDSEGRSSVSFTFQKKAKAPQVIPAPQEQESKDFVLSLVGNKIKSTKPVPKKKEYVIPLKTELQPTVSSGGRSEEGNDKSKEGGEGEKKEGSGKKSEEELQLEREAAAAVLKDVHDAKLQLQEGSPVDTQSHIISMLQNKPKSEFKADLETKPPQSSMEEYEEMPIGEFGKALLRGMGWKEGMAMGRTNKGMMEPIEFLGRPHMLGLGATPKPKEPPKKHRIKKQGEEERKIQGPYIGKDGRVKHTRNIGEAIPEQPLIGFVAGNFAVVLVGPHEGLYGKIASVEDSSKRVLLKMAINDQVLKFSQYHLKLVSKREYLLGRPLEEEEEGGVGREGLHGSRSAKPKEVQYGLITRNGSGSDVKSKKPNDSHLKSSKHVEDKRDTNDSRGKKRTSGHLSDLHHHDDKYHHGGGRETDSKRVRRTEPAEVKKPSAKALKQQSAGGEENWLSSNLRVKVVDRAYKNGRHYNTKVSVVDVVSLGTCVCQTEDGKLLEGVMQNMVETVVPRKPMSVVKVVRGKRKNELAIVVNQDRAKAEAVIQLTLSKEVMNVDFDDICEYLGETDVNDYLG